MRLSLTLAAPFLVLLATGGVQAQSAYSTSETDDGQACLVFDDNISAVRASQEAAARGLPLCDDVDLSITGSITRSPDYVVPQSIVQQDDQHKN
jgi:hypothetical protein